MARVGIGIDIGSHAAKVVVARMKGTRFYPVKAALLEGETSLGEWLNAQKIKGPAILGVTGKEMIIRYTQVTPMPDWQLKQVMGFEIDDLSVQSGGGLSADFNRLEVTASLSEDDIILLTLIKDTRLNILTSRLSASKVTPSCFTPNAIALYNYMARTDVAQKGTTLVLGVGADNIDLALVQDGGLIFARNLSGGSNLFNQALMDGFNLSSEKAERVKKEFGCLAVRTRQERLTAQQEKVARALATPVGQIYSMVQSSLLFCKAQIKVADLALDRVILTGGGARLNGLDRYMEENLGIPALVHDPSKDLDLTGLEDADDLKKHGPAFTSAMGLALMSATPDHYAIHVLPEGIRKTRHFREHTLFGILCVLVLALFLGAGFFLSMKDADVLQRDIGRMRAEIARRERAAEEMGELTEKSRRQVDILNRIDEKTIPTTGFIRTFSLIQRHLPEDLWVQSIEIDSAAREEFGTKDKAKPVILVRGTGKEMGRPLQKSFNEFRTALDADPLTRGIIPQVRYGEDFSFTLTINFSSFLGTKEEEGEGEGEGEEEEREG